MKNNVKKSAYEAEWFESDMKTSSIDEYCTQMSGDQTRCDVEKRYSNMRALPF